MSTPSPQHVDQRQFLGHVRNHAELRRILTDLHLASDTSPIRDAAQDVARCWINLAKEHLKDARTALKDHTTRAVHSRAYYAVYNASKAVRYYTSGWVSLKGDDHKQASTLPDDFPDVDQWTTTIPELYADRLRADYDNWSLTAQERVYEPSKSVDLAEEFLKRCEEYLRSHHGVAL
jgi:uncharacterized protein (UPF0332 family)